MIITNNDDLKTYRKAGEISTQIIRTMADELKPGIYPDELETLCWDLCRKYHVEPSFYGVEMNDSVFPASCNINVNDEILHSIPSATRKLQKGDVVKIDFGLIYQGFYTDHCYTFGIQELSKEDARLVAVAKMATEEAVKRAVVGNTTGDLGYTMDSITALSGFEVLSNYIGHGIGKSLHEDPPIPAYGQPGKGYKLKDGMVICVECQVKPGTDETYIADDEWTVMTDDGEKGAMFEYMVVVRKDKPEILTPMQNWSTII